MLQLNHRIVDENTTYELSSWLQRFILPGSKARLKIEFYSGPPTASNILDRVHGDEYGTYEEWENVTMQATAPSEAKVRSHLLEAIWAWNSAL